MVKKSTEKSTMTLTIAQMYILQVLRNKECVSDDIFAQIEKVKNPSFSIHKKMMYHHIDLLGKKGLIQVEKSHALPPRLTIKITDAGLKELNSLYLFIKENTSPPQNQQMKAQPKYPPKSKSLDTENIEMSIESSAIELLNKEYETVTDAEKARIARFVKKILKIIEDNT